MKFLLNDLWNGRAKEWNKQKRVRIVQVCLATMRLHTWQHCIWHTESFRYLLQWLYTRNQARLMSPSRAEGYSARLVIPFSSELKIDQKRAEISIFSFFIIFHDKLSLKMIMKLIEIMMQEQNWEICKKIAIFWHTYQVSVSARKLKCPGSAQLELENSSWKRYQNHLFFDIIAFDCV